MVHGANKSLCKAAGHYALSLCRAGKIYSLRASPERPTESQAPVKMRQKRCLIELCHVVLLKVEIAEFCLDGPMAGVQISRGGSLADGSPRSSDRWQDNTSEESVGNVLYGTVAKHRV
jgi:hypothetical protein